VKIQIQKIFDFGMQDFWARDQDPFATFVTEGMEIKGWPELTLSRGKVVWADGEVKADVGNGLFVECELSDAAKPRSH